VFGGQSYGYKTKYHNVTYNTVAPTYDSYLFKYDPNENSRCFYTNDMSKSELTASTEVADSSVPPLKYKNGFYRYTNTRDVSNIVKDRYLFKQMNNLFLGYTSKYSGSFDLVETLKYPRMCA